MKSFIMAVLAMASMVAFGHQDKKTESLNWRCDYCHTAYKRVTVYRWVYTWYNNGYWHVVSQTKCPGCGR